MTVEKAIDQLIASDEFKTAAKSLSNSKLRVYLGRYNKGTLGPCGMIELLQTFGYTIDVKPPKKTRKI